MSIVGDDEHRGDPAARRARQGPGAGRDPQATAVVISADDKCLRFSEATQHAPTDGFT
jgi:hypothetical protein